LKFLKENGGTLEMKLEIHVWPVFADQYQKSPASEIFLVCKLKDKKLLNFDKTANFQPHKQELSINKLNSHT
jgi:hypothetical protein